jgi:hypothetical protein
LVFRTEDAPEYIPGLWACIACSLMAIITVITLDFYFWTCNKKADRGEMVIEGSEVSTCVERIFLGPAN